MSEAVQTTEDTEFVKFWNEVLAPKFIRFKHILVDGLTQHSEAIFPQLPVQKGDRVLDVGCGFGDTAIKLAKLVGPTGYVVGIDCCDVFLKRMSVRRCPLIACFRPLYPPKADISDSLANVR